MKEKQNISKVFKCSLKNFFSPETTKDILKEKEERDRGQAYYIINMFMLFLIQDYIHNVVLLRIYCTLPLCKQRDIKKITRTKIMIWTINSFIPQNFGMDPDPGLREIWIQLWSDLIKIKPDFSDIQGKIRS